MEEIIREVRWELDRRGFHNVKIFVSGGLNEETVKKFSEAGADAFGVGTRISGARPVDFGMDIVEIEGRPIAKRGILSGSKDLYICDEHLIYSFVPRGQDPPRCPVCGGRMRYSYVKAMENGKIKVDLKPAIEIREETRKILRKLRELNRGF